MKNFCTAADVNFAPRVLALNDSLKKFSNDYTLHLLCLDKEIFDAIEDENIKKYSLSSLMRTDKLLESASSNKPSREALINSKSIEQATKLQFIWALSAYFSWYCLDVLEIEDILYIDSDIYFYNDWRVIYESVGEASVGIVEHRCKYNPDNGKYNVGIVYFKNDLDGYRCAFFWKNWLLTVGHEYYESHSTCGDQKYLELFPILFDNVIVLDKFIGHLAPWNFLSHEYKKNKIIWNGIEQDLLYCHFSNFKLTPDGYVVAARHGYISPPNQYIKSISDEYYEKLRQYK